MILNFKGARQCQNLKLWIDSTPEIRSETVKVKRIELPANKSVKVDNKILAVEFGDTFRHASNYALLCADYHYEETGALTVQINLSESNGIEYKQAVPNIGGIIRTGIIKSYADGILLAAKDFANKNNKLFPGTLCFFTGAHGVTGSSQLAFYWITKMIFTWLTKFAPQKDILQSDIEQEMAAILSTGRK